MTEANLQSKLNQLVKLANELDAEAKARYGAKAGLFYKAEGTFFIMAGDAGKGTAERQEFIRHQSRGYCRMGGGAW